MAVESHFQWVRMEHTNARVTVLAPRVGAKPATFPLLLLDAVLFCGLVSCLVVGSLLERDPGLAVTVGGMMALSLCALFVLVLQTVRPPPGLSHMTNKLVLESGVTGATASLLQIDDQWLPLNTLQSLSLENVPSVRSRYGTSKAYDRLLLHFHDRSVLIQPIETPRDADALAAFLARSAGVALPTRSELRRAGLGFAFALGVMLICAALAISIAASMQRWDALLRVGAALLFSAACVAARVAVGMNNQRRLTALRRRG